MSHGTRGVSVIQELNQRPEVGRPHLHEVEPPPFIEPPPFTGHHMLVAPLNLAPGIMQGSLLFLVLSPLHYQNKTLARSLTRPRERPSYHAPSLYT